MALSLFETPDQKLQRERKKFGISVEQEIQRFTRAKGAIAVRQLQDKDDEEEAKRQELGFQRQRFRELIAPQMDTVIQGVNDIQTERTKFRELIMPSVEQEVQRFSRQEESNKFRSLVQPSLDALRTPTATATPSPPAQTPLGGVGGGFDMAGGQPQSPVPTRRQANELLSLIGADPSLVGPLGRDEGGFEPLHDYLTTIVEGAPASAVAQGFGEGRFAIPSNLSELVQLGKEAITPLPPPELFEAIDKLPVGGSGASRAAQFATSPAGLISAAVFPVATGAGLAAGAAGFNIGRVIERLGFDERLKVGPATIGPAGFLEAAFGLYGGPGRSAASRLATKEGQLITKSGQAAGFSQDSARILTGIGFDGNGMRELRLAGLTDDVLRNTVREVITDTPEGALGSTIRGMTTASGGRYLNDLQQGKGYFARAREALPASAESGLDVFGAAPPRALSAAREGGEVLSGTLPDSLREAIGVGIARMRQRIRAVRPQRHAQVGGRIEASERAYRQALAKGVSREEALSIQTRALEGPLDRATQIRLDISDADWERVSRIVDDFDFGRGGGTGDFERRRVRSLIGVLKGGKRKQAIQRNELDSLARILGDDIVDDLTRVLDDANLVELDVSDLLDVPAGQRFAPVDPARPLQPGETPGLGPDVGSGYVDVPGGRRVLTDPELTNPVSEEARATERALGESLTRGVDPFDPQGRVPLADIKRPPGRTAKPGDDFPQQEITDAKLRPLAQPQSPMRRFVDSFKIIQTVQQSFDLSFHFNQGAKLGWRHPREWAKSFYRGIRAARSEETTAFLDTQMRGLGDASDDIGRKAQTEVLLTTPDGPKRVKYGEVADKVMRVIRGVEEDDYWMSRTAERIPGVKPSENAFTTSGNSLRFDVGYHMLNRITKGFTVGITEKQAGEIGRALQRLSGRGNLDFLGGYKSAIQAIFRAPGYRISSPQALMLLGSRNPEVRRLAWESLLTWGVATGSVMMLMDQAGGELDMNPNSSEFGRVRFGNTSYHLWGADQTLARSAMQIIMQSAQGREVTLPDGTKTAPKWETNWKKVLENYGWSGIDPALGEARAFYQGENYVGEPVNFTTFEGMFNAIKDVLPLSLQDAWDAYQSDGAFQALVTGIFASTGGRTTSYSQEADDAVDLMRKYTTISEETERLLRPFQEDVDVAWGSAKQHWFQTLGITKSPWPMTKAEVAIDWGEQNDTPNLGSYAADAIRGSLVIRQDFVDYIKEHQDELGADTLGYALPDAIALDILTEANYDRYTEFNARER